MYQRYVSQALRLSLLSFLLGFGIVTNASAKDKQYFETRFCQNCNYNQARFVASKIKPEINCEERDKQTNTVKTKACRATSINVLVIDPDSRDMWRFENIYLKQSKTDEYMLAGAPHQSLIPPEAIMVANQLLDIYENIHKITLEARKNLKADNIIATKKAQASKEVCGAYQFTDALDAVFGERFKHNLQQQLQHKMDELPNWKSGLIEAEMGIPDFTIGNSSVLLTGAWGYALKSMHFSRIFGSEAIKGRTQVGYNAIIVGGELVLELNDILTSFSGMGLDIMKERQTSVTLYHECFAKALDAKYPKTITDPPDIIAAKKRAGHKLDDIKPVYNHDVPLVYSGNPKDYCVHNYYINSQRTFSIEGKCS